MITQWRGKNRQRKNFPNTVAVWEIKKELREREEILSNMHSKGEELTKTLFS